ncbi:MAG: hypothetical protein IT186_21390 [Acidobacteria bacterium]|nr:hypothetical protein [Acidobacteriota bacterium]
MDAKTTARSWLWPDRVIPKAESRQIREEHNALVNSHHDLLEVCKELLEEHYLFHVEREKWICPYCLCEAFYTPVNFPHSSTCPVIKARQVIAKAEGR